MLHFLVNLLTCVRVPPGDEHEQFLAAVKRGRRRSFINRKYLSPDSIREVNISHKARQHAMKGDYNAAVKEVQSLLYMNELQCIGRRLL